MKTVTLTDEEVQELREILNSKISKYLDDFWKFLKFYVNINYLKIF